MSSVCSDLSSVALGLARKPAPSASQRCAPALRLAPAEPPAAAAACFPALPLGTTTANGRAGRHWSAPLPLLRARARVRWQRRARWHRRVRSEGGPVRALSSPAAWSSLMTPRARGRVRGHGARRRWWRRWRRRGWRRRPWSSLRAHAPPPCSRQRRAPRGRAAPCSQSSLVAVAVAPHSLPLPVRRVPSLLATADPHSSLPAEPHSLPPVDPHSLPRGPPTQAASPGSSRRRERGGRGAYRSS